MNDDVKHKFDSLAKYPFFQACGKPLPEDIASAKNWVEAAMLCSSRKWENCRLMPSNALASKVNELSWERRQGWNALAEELHTASSALLTGVLSSSPVPSQFHEQVKGRAEWDLMFICIEYHFRDLVTPMFHIPYLEPWYARGHFPCGWDGIEFSNRWHGVVDRDRVIVF